jgi:inosose dehydratase
MMKFELGIGPDSWGVWFPSDPLQPPFEQFLSEVHEAGYQTIELGPYGYLPTEPRRLSSVLDAHELRVSGGFVLGDLHSEDSWDALRDSIEDTCSLLGKVNAEFLVLIDAMYTDLYTGVQVSSPELTESQWRSIVRTSHRIAAYARENFGLRTAFHPHVETPIEFEHQIEKFLSLTDPDLVSLCLDTGHHAYRDGDVASFMRQHHQRIPYLHIKSVNPAVMSEVRSNRLPFATAVKDGAFTEPKAGNVDFRQFREVLEEIDFRGIGIVEQDMYPAPFDKPLPIAVSTRNYMHEIGYR